MSVLLPTDLNGQTIPVLGFKADGTTTIYADASPQSVIVEASGEEPSIVTLLSTGPVRFLVGDVDTVFDPGQNAYLVADNYFDIPVYADRNHIWLVADGSPCTVFVMERD
jgi:hypothetical protein